MRILYSPEYAGRVYTGRDECLMDTMVCDTAALVRLLEMRLNIYAEEMPQHLRLVKYYNAMSEYMAAHDGNALSKSFDLSPLGTAREALAWRDALLAARWQPLLRREPTNGSDRVDIIAGIEPLFDAPGLPDRLLNVIKAIKEHEADLCDKMTVELPCERRLLHPMVNRLLDTMLEQGAEIIEETIDVNNGDTNLRRAARLLYRNADTPIDLDPRDKSLEVLRFADMHDATAYMARKMTDTDADVWIAGDSKTLDNQLRLVGKPVVGSAMAPSAPQVTQLMLLGIDMMREPLNIHSLINWLYCPMQPLGARAGYALAGAVISSGGWRNDACREVVKRFIKGDFESNNDGKGHKRRSKLAETFLPPFEPAASISRARLIGMLDALTAWARQRTLQLVAEGGNEGWCRQLSSLMVMCETMATLVHDTAIGETVAERQLDSLLATLYRGENFTQYEPQAGATVCINDMSRMQARSGHTVWMCQETVCRHFDCDFLFPSERKRLAGSYEPWDRSHEAEFRRLMSLRPLTHTDGRLTLVVAESDDGEGLVDHPVLVQLGRMVKNLDVFTKWPSLSDEASIEVPIVANGPSDGIIRFDHAELLPWPEYMSPTVLDTMVQYPLDYLLGRQLNITAAGPDSIKSVDKTLGLVAHAVIEHLFAPRDGQTAVTSAEVRQRVNAEWERTLRHCIEADGAILDLPENRHAAARLKEQLRRCIGNLLDILDANGLSVTGCERPLQVDLGFIAGEQEWDMKGYIDMTLEDRNGRPVVIDFKWTTWSGYRDLLKNNRSTQLELYRAMLGRESGRRVERTAYFIMPDGHLYSKEPFAGPHCTQVETENNDDIVEQLRNAYHYRRAQLERGIVEVGESVELDDLPYYKDTIGENLFPLEQGDDGRQKENRFSDYKLFKQ